jgi:cytochrome c biogenesis protein
VKKIWTLLNSRKFAVYLLFLFLVILILSAFLPSEITLTAAEWEELKAGKPLKYWLATHFSTPYVVRGPLFIIVSLFLFFSTLTCTVTRVKNWLRLKRAEFEKEKAFSFKSEAASAGPPEEMAEMLLARLRMKRWECSAQEDVVFAQKGLKFGFWGSVGFHMGLIVCFLAAPVTALTLFRGEVVLTDGVTMPLDQVVEVVEGPGATMLPDVKVAVRDLWGIYYKGEHKVNFGGTMDIDGQEIPFSVNKSVYHGEYQFSLYAFGYSPGIVIEKNGETVFDYFLNLRHSVKGDYFDFQSEGFRIFVLFFPDFERQGSILSTVSQEPNNPVLLVKFIKDGKALHKGLLLKPGEDAEFGDYRVRFGELRNWVSMLMVKGRGMPLIAIGFVIGIPGLFVRFLSNERRIEFEFKKAEKGTLVAVRGYSRYYPAFLEKEVNEMADALKTEGQKGG